MRAGDQRLAPMGPRRERGRRNRTSLAALVSALGFVAVGSTLPACPSPTTGEGEGEGEGDGDGDDCAAGLPPPSDPCLPTSGNQQFVGQPCTQGGGKCNEHIGQGAGFCTVGFDETTTLAYCTRSCAEDADGGSDAVYTGDPSDPDGPEACIPVACVAAEGEGEGATDR